MTTGDFIKFAPESLVFTCATDNNQSQHAYPRPGDGNYNAFMEITASDATTVTVNAGVSSDTSTHSFVSAAPDSVVTQRTIYGGELISQIEGKKLSKFMQSKVVISRSTRNFKQSIF